MSESPGSRDFSLRTRLLVGILSIVAVVWLLSAFASYAQARRVVEHRLDDDWKSRLVKVFRWQQ